VIGKRKFTVIVVFMITMVVALVGVGIFVPSAITAELLQSFFITYGMVVGTGIGAMGVENLAKYGLGKKNKEEVEP